MEYPTRDISLTRLICLHKTIERIPHPYIDLTTYFVPGPPPVGDPIGWACQRQYFKERGLHLKNGIPCYGPFEEHQAIDYFFGRHTHYFIGMFSCQLNSHLSSEQQKKKCLEEIVYAIQMKT